MFYHVFALIPSLPILHTLSLMICSGRLVAAAATIAIDDTYGDAVIGAMPVYNPPTSWTQGQPCVPGECLVNPDPNQVWNGTWHDSVSATDDVPPRTIDLSFEGDSIRVFCIISEVDRVEITVANMTFELDGEEVGEYFHDPDGNMDLAGNYQIAYNVPVYQNMSIPHGNHTLRINSIGYSRMLFDYALYTTNSDLSSSTTSIPPSSASGTGASNTAVNVQKPQPPTPSLAVIVGAAVGGTATLVVIIALAFFLIRRRRRATKRHAYHIDLAERETRVYGKDDNDSRSHLSESTESSAAFERPPTPFFPYSLSNRSQSTTSRFHEDMEEQSVNQLSPTDSIPLVDFPLPPSHVEQPLPRIVITGAETHLVGPDNSMARYARQEVAEREVELTRRMREMEAALAAKYGAPAPSSSDLASLDPSSKLPADLARSGSVQSTVSGGPEVALRSQVDELRAEIERMRTVQQRMALELRDATEPPPEYQ